MAGRSHRSMVRRREDEVVFRTMAQRGRSRKAPWPGRTGDAYPPPGARIGQADVMTLSLSRGLALLSARGRLTRQLVHARNPRARARADALSAAQLVPTRRNP